jgi:hypothetical protein
LRKLGHIDNYDNFQRVGKGETALEGMRGAIDRGEAVEWRALDKMSSHEGWQRNAAGEQTTEDLDAGVKSGVHAGGEMHKDGSALRKLGHIDNYDNFQRVGKGETALEGMRGAIDRGEAVEWRALDKMSAAEGWQRTGKDDSGLVPIEDDAGNNAGASHDFEFRKLDKISYTEDFQRTGRDESAIVGIEGRQDAGANHNFKFREFESVEGVQDFQRYHKEGSGIVPIANDGGQTAGASHAFEFRKLDKISYTEDFQRTGRDETAIIDRPSARLGEYDESEHEFRDVAKLPHGDDFQRAGVDETAMVGRDTARLGDCNILSHASGAYPLILSL